MLNTCPHCEEKFQSWVSYNEHLAFSHWKSQDICQSPFEEDVISEEQIATIKTYFSGRTDLQKKAWNGYMPKAQKDAIVNAWESKQKKGAVIS